MRVFLFCNDNYGSAYANTAARLARARGYDIRVVLSGKRRRTHPGAIVARLGIRVDVVDDVNSRPFLAEVAPGDNAVIAGFNQIFRADAIERFASFVNFHPSLLPLYRGPLPSYWCLKNRETSSGFTLHRVTRAIDAGEILHQEIVPVGDARHPRQLDRRIAARGAKCFERWLEHLATGEPWRSRALVDARAVYRRPLDYAPYPQERESVSP